MIRLPVISFQSTVLYPLTIASYELDAPEHLAALDHLLEKGQRRVLIVAQRFQATAKEGQENPGHAFYERGTIGEILQALKPEDSPAKIIVEGVGEAIATDYQVTEGGYVSAAVVNREVDAVGGVPAEAEAMRRAILKQMERQAELLEELSPDVLQSLQSVDELLTFVYQAANYSILPIEKKQAILEAPALGSKLRNLLEALQAENELRDLEQSIVTQVRSQIGKSQREFFLNEQIKALERELGVNDEDQELEEFQQQLEKRRGMSKEARERGERELGRLSRMPALSPEATVSRTYLETLLDLPWGRHSRDNRDIDKAEAILNEDHYGLEKPKDRILEYLAVLSRVGKIRGPILCLVGPPGVGKTSLAQSIARALNRQFVRIALGGVRDEAEIRGHRRTYIGSMPGKIIQSIIKSGRMNPVMLLDEIDKMSRDFRGDPASALLEVLDPEQNSAFNDHYLEIDFDLSRVLFITTANHRNGIPAPLLDRMELIRLSGYTEDEKLEIARQYLLPKQLKEHGLKEKDLVTPEADLRWMIRHYTKEAGVRSLERRVAALCRKTVRGAMQDKLELPYEMNSVSIREHLGPAPYRDAKHRPEPELAVATGLAWTEVGGELLQVETSVVPGKGALVLTGKLGDVMQESAKAALTYIRHRSEALGVAKDFHKTSDIHVHLPEGAVPKDGPSAGVTMVTSIVSALSGRNVRQDIAMTGEINLRGRVLRIGGLKEKVLAARREEIRDVILPEANVDELDDIPANVREEMNFHPVESLDEVLELVLEPKKKKRSTSKAKGTKGPRKSGPKSSTGRAPAQASKQARTSDE